MLIHGDNLMALKALEHQYAGKVKCIYIDPPYNTGAAFEHYDDNFEHSTWLNLMRPRLELLRKLLAEDGVIFVQIDDNEQAYLKVMMDEIFGRDKFIANIVWRKKAGGGQDSEFFVIEHENILVYRKSTWKIIDAKAVPDESDYNKVIHGRRAKLVKLEKWGTSPYKEDRPSLYYPIKNPDNEDFFPLAPDGRDGRWRKKPETLDVNHIKWEKRNERWMPYEILYFDEAENKTIKTRSIWTDYGNNTEAANEIKALLYAKAFDTPKPERLIERILTLATNPGDLVLDSFLGSGTTAAVAHKMGRRYIGVEIGDHAYTHCKTRLDKVIAGEDQGGITKSIGWTGGGGYRFYELAPSLINTDEYGQSTISKSYNDEMLARAIALHEGFTYSPDEAIFWKQSKGSEKSYLYVTSHFVSKELVESIHNTMNDDEYLIIACKSYASGIKMPNITIKKIPQAVLGRCEFGKSDYNLNVLVNDTDSDFELEDTLDEGAEANTETENKETSERTSEQISIDFADDDDETWSRNRTWDEGTWAGRCKE